MCLIRENSLLRKKVGQEIFFSMGFILMKLDEEFSSQCANIQHSVVAVSILFSQYFGGGSYPHAIVLTVDHKYNFIISSRNVFLLNKEIITGIQTLSVSVVS